MNKKIAIISIKELLFDSLSRIFGIIVTNINSYKITENGFMELELTDTCTYLGQGLITIENPEYDPEGDPQTQSPQYIEVMGERELTKKQERKKSYPIELINPLAVALDAKSQIENETFFNDINDLMPHALLAFTQQECMSGIDGIGAFGSTAQDWKIYVPEETETEE
ncbi:MAG: hypothetical protein LBE36_06665 [Flavobacteriaceae bacterium]|jgi:hypothetical protein|nr:hypothetical protein [Flavobacteriaceae bacterium]